MGAARKADQGLIRELECFRYLSEEVITQYDNAKTTIALLGRGQSIGEMSLIDGRSRSATVRVKTNLTLVVLKREHFQTLLVEHPGTTNNILMGIAQLLSGSLRKTTHEFTEKCSRFVNAPRRTTSEGQGELTR